MRRRGFLASFVAALTAPRSWAAAGSPEFLAAARHPDGSFWLHGLGTDGADVFAIPLPARGHAAAAHPQRPEAVAFARRPGTFAIILDCALGTVIARLKAPSGHHFYGHGAFTSDGNLLLTTENRFESGQGRIGVWSVAEGYRRVGDMPSGGTGPHDIIRLPNEGFAVANGGIRTHPDTGREKLNLDTMRSNLTLLKNDGSISEKFNLSPELRLNSIRHLAVNRDGLVAFATQWQGDPFDGPPLVGVFGSGSSAVLYSGSELEQIRTRGYAASVAFSGDGKFIGFTAPRGGEMHLFDSKSGHFRTRVTETDVSGLTASHSGMCATSGTGAFFTIKGERAIETQRHLLQWDNHLVRVIG